MANQKKQNRMGRPRQSDEERALTKRLIIDTARALFIEEGIEAVSMRKIAKKGGFSQRLPYLYFEDKRAILKYVWDDFFIALFQHCEDYIREETDAKKCLTDFLIAYADYWLTHTEQFELVFLQKDQLTGPNDHYYAYEFGAIERYQTITQLVDTCITEGVIQATSDADLIAQVLIANLHGILHGLVTISEYPWKDQHQIINFWLDTMLRGLRE
ncbi:MAG: TetR/AcrR family transcriptional regulator [Chloroflexota bacterium]